MADTISDESVFYCVEHAIRFPSRDQRRGQSGFNALIECRQDIANAIVATDADPFYDDGNIERFLLRIIDLL